MPAFYTDTPDFLWLSHYIYIYIYIYKPYNEGDCPGECYPEGVIATNAIKVLGEKVLAPEVPFFHAVGFKRSV